MTKEEKTVFEAAIELWGVPNQFAQALEETAELQVAIHKIRRGRHENLNELAGEVADVQIMLDQIKVIYGSEFEQQVKEVRESKVKRLLGRIINAKA